MSDAVLRQMRARQRVSPLRRLSWRLNARRHRQLDPPNMSELPWARYAMDEQTGEIYDRRTWGRRAAVRRFRRENYALGAPVVEARYARYLTTQEIWEARDREEEWLARLEDEYESRNWPTDSAAMLKAKPVPREAPADWEPDGEWDPAWEFCAADMPRAAPVWLCEMAEAARS
jgi:hypothetical protein